METHQIIVGFVKELRKTILLLGFVIALCTIGLYFLSPKILHVLRHHLDQELAFYSVAEPFLSLLKLAFFVALFFLMPWITYVFWKALAKTFGLSGKSLWLFVVFTCLLFYAGAGFCYFITLPFGVKFLLGFQSEQLKPLIAVGKFVNFVSLFVLAFGVIFELPMFMVFSARVGIVPRSAFEKNRRYAILAISIMSALLTPTPDIVNMLLMGAPLYLLYELGIIILKIMRN